MIYFDRARLHDHDNYYSDRQHRNCNRIKKRVADLVRAKLNFVIVVYMGIVKQQADHEYVNACTHNRTNHAADRAVMIEKATRVGVVLISCKFIATFE